METEHTEVLTEAQVGSILVVDDDEASRALYTYALAAGEMRSTGAANAEDALALVLADPSAIEAILLDVWLPGMGGVELLRGDSPHPGHHADRLGRR